MAPALGRLRAFRCGLFGCFGRRADALFELSDAILTAGAVHSPALVSRLGRRGTRGGEAPLFVFDAGYDPVSLQRELDGFDSGTIAAQA